MNELQSMDMRPLSTLEGIGNFDILPLPQQESFTTRDRINTQNLLPMVLFHDQHQICPAEVRNRELRSAMCFKIQTFSPQQRSHGLIYRMIDQRAGAR